MHIDRRAKVANVKGVRRAYTLWLPENKEGRKGILAFHILANSNILCHTNHCYAIHQREKKEANKLHSKTKL